jgi:hypothetical protein
VGLGVFSDLLGSFCRSEFEAGISDRTLIWTMLNRIFVRPGGLTREVLGLKEIRKSAR